MTRRRFLGTAGVGTVVLGGVVTGAAPGTGEVMTVTGRVSVRDLGRMLVHEHVTTDFLGAERAPGPRYDRDLAMATVLPELKALAARGIGTLVECTPAHIGRDVELLRRLSLESGVRLVTNTGYYGAVDNKFLPRHAHEEGEEALARRWLAEWEDGIGGTGIRPGFIKLGTGGGRLSGVHAKLLRAACRVHLRTGLTIAAHTGDGEAARHQVEILRGEGVAPTALIWVHAQNDPGPIQLELARLGVWISLDGYSLATQNPARYLNFLKAHRDAGTLGCALLSHDDGWAVEGEGLSGAGLKLFGNGNPRPYTSIFERLLPDLERAGFTEGEVDRLLRVNPAEALTIRVRKEEAA